MTTQKMYDITTQNDISDNLTAYFRALSRIFWWLFLAAPGGFPVIKNNPAVPDRGQPDAA